MPSQGPGSQPLRDGIEARAPGAISGQQQHQVVHRTWRLKQAQLRKLPLANDFLVHAARRRTALAQERGTGGEQQRPPRTAADQPGQLLRKADKSVMELNDHATLFHCGCMSAITVRARLQAKRSW